MNLIQFDGARVKNDSLIYEFSQDNKPALTIKSGEEVLLETCDCFEDQLSSEHDELDKLDWDHVNPATGPVYVEGAEPGDVLKVEILKIELADEATIMTGEGVGVYGEKLSDGLSVRYAKVHDNILEWDDKVAFEIDPMIGVIGVAPAGDPVNTGTPGSHGGNMDNTMVREGATLYFPVSAPGALFAAGDMHAIMGDGEIGVSGAEIAGEILVRLTVVKGLEISDPVLIDQDDFSTIASADTMDEAAKKAVINMIELLKPRLPLSAKDITMLLSLAADVEVCQMVDPQLTMRYVISRDVLDAYDFEFEPQL
ncbi:MAG: acetamidase/formamidase family protein [Coriobacteriia bacterium]|nr:acetamidase/formamidase family protein [Coriobacteriia bacterium]